MQPISVISFIHSVDRSCKVPLKKKVKGEKNWKVSVNLTPVKTISVKVATSYEQEDI